MTKQQQNIINHISIVLDGSTSMKPHVDALIKVADAQIQHLAKRSKELDQETRVTVYMFADTVNCLIYDKDVLRLPSIATLYRANGNTALIDAVLLSQEDLALVSEKYGEHSFLTFVLTDGEENQSRNTAMTLQQKMRALPSHWTVAMMVPNQRAKYTAQQYGFAPGNIEVWDTTSQQGLEEAVEKVKVATDTYMTNRASGLRGSQNLFDTSHVTQATVAASGIKPLDASQYVLVPVAASALDEVNAAGHKVIEISRFVEKCGHRFRLGSAYYQLIERSRIQGNKSIAIVSKNTLGKVPEVFTGPQARALLGLGNADVRIAPSFNKEYDIFVQSTSINRHLKAGQKVLLLL